VVAITAAAALYSREQLASRRDTANALLRGLGVLREGADDGIISFDPLPLVLDTTEWAAIQAGVQQRARMLEYFIRDIYQGLNIARDGVIPIPSVLGFPGYLRECHGIRTPQDTPARIMAFDLMKDPLGHWHVVADRVSTPQGLATALQARRTQRQIFPELFETEDILPVSQFTTQLLEHLLVSRPGAATPHDTVLLSDPRTPQAIFEDNFLARKMGLSLATAQDLVVRDGALFFRTIEGLRRVGLVYRMVDGTEVDPVALRGNTGIPGLMSCIRSGTVVATNFPGCAAADNRGLLSYSDSLIRYYLGEDPLLPTIKTQWLLDAERAAYIAERSGAFIVARADGRPLYGREWADIVRSEHFSLVVHPRSQPLLHRRQPAEVLRCFALVSESNVSLLQGGLAMVLPSEDCLNARSMVLRDAWVLAETRGTTRRPHSDRRSVSVRMQALGSRTAEAMYWLGRYCERAECTARMVSALGEARLDTDLHGSDPWAPLWDAVGRVTGHGNEFVTPEFKSKIDDGTAAHFLTLDLSHSASVATALKLAHSNALSLQDSISPEAWFVIHRLWQSVQCLMTSAGDRTPAARAALDTIMNQLSALHGMMSRTMLHDVGSQFFYAGAHLERSLVTLGATSRVFDSPAAFVHTDEDVDLENPILNTLLAMIGTLDAYRRTFQSRALPIPVLDILLHEPRSPISILFCMGKLQRFFARHGATAVGATDLIERISQRLQATRSETATAADQGSSALRECATLHLEELYGLFEELHVTTSDIFFSHQMLAYRLGEGNT